MERYGDKACLFERLALIETISFEDFELSAVLNAMPDIHSASFVSTHCQSAATDKRVVLLDSDHLEDVTMVRTQDIICIQLNPMGSFDSLADLAAPFGALSANQVRVCVLGRCREGETRYAAEMLAAAQWLEWKAPYEDASTCSSLIFSPHWRGDVPGHTAKVIRNYMATLSEPEFLSSRVRMGKWVVGAHA